MRAVERALGRIHQEGVGEYAFVTQENLVAALETVETATLAPRRATGAEPIHQHQPAAGLQKKLLPLGVRGTREGLDRIGRINQQRTGGEFCLHPMTARPGIRIAVHFGLSLRADKTACPFAEFEFHARFVTGHQTTPQTAQVSPDTRTARAWNQQLQGALRPRRGGGTQAVNDFNAQVSAAVANLRWFRAGDGKDVLPCPVWGRSMLRSNHWVEFGFMTTFSRQAMRSFAAMS